jgi:hypothetical protein
MTITHQRTLQEIIENNSIPPRAALELTAALVEILTEVNGIAIISGSKVNLDSFSSYSDGQLCLNDPENLRPVTMSALGLTLASFLMEMELAPVSPNDRVYRSYITAILSVLEDRYASQPIWTDLYQLLAMMLHPSSGRITPLEVIHQCQRLASRAPGESLQAFMRPHFHTPWQAHNSSRFFQQALIVGLPTLMSIMR